MKTRPTPVPQASIESAGPSPAGTPGDAQAIDAVALDDVTGGCRRCGCGAQVAYSYQSSSGIDPQRLALAFAFSSLASQRK